MRYFNARVPTHMDLTAYFHGGATVGYQYDIYGYPVRCGLIEPENCDDPDIFWFWGFAGTD